MVESQHPILFLLLFSTVFFSLIRHQSFYLSIFCISSQFLFLPLLHQVPQDVQQHTSDITQEEFVPTFCQKDRPIMAIPYLAPLF
jgi:hypothetical protein